MPQEGPQFGLNDLGQETTARRLCLERALAREPFESVKHGVVCAKRVYNIIITAKVTWKVERENISRKRVAAPEVMGERLRTWGRKPLSWEITAFLWFSRIWKTRVFSKPRVLFRNPGFFEWTYVFIGSWSFRYSYHGLFHKYILGPYSDIQHLVSGMHIQVGSLTSRD